MKLDDIIFEYFCNEAERAGLDIFDEGVIDDLKNKTQDISKKVKSAGKSFKAGYGYARSVNQSRDEDGEGNRIKNDSEKRVSGTSHSPIAARAGAAIGRMVNKGENLIQDKQKMYVLAKKAGFSKDYSLYISGRRNETSKEFKRWMNMLFQRSESKLTKYANDEDQRKQRWKEEAEDQRRLNDQTNSTKMRLAPEAENFLRKYRKAMGAPGNEDEYIKQFKKSNGLEESIFFEDGDIPSRFEFKLYKLFCKIMIKILSVMEGFLKNIDTPNAQELLKEIKNYKLKYNLEHFASTLGVGLHDINNSFKKTSKKLFGESEENLNFNFDFKFTPLEMLRMIIEGVKLINSFNKQIKALPSGEEKEEGQKLCKEIVGEFRNILPKMKIPGINKVVAMLPAPDTLKEEIVGLSKRNFT
jgi:hypothetical protein